mmetsp:Transcript_21545/g.31876  ORF Transcript_21545/g.31876 Transcript_21545/m.31876 type:complete len:95 (+) Transcript_21545:549-833(+)
MAHAPNHDRTQQPQHNGGLFHSHLIMAENSGFDDTSAPLSARHQHYARSEYGWHSYMLWKSSLIVSISSNVALQGYPPMPVRLEKNQSTYECCR